MVNDIAVAVVDNSRTSQSRDLVRQLDATPAIDVVGYASSLSEAKRWHAEKRCYGITNDAKPCSVSPRKKAWLLIGAPPPMLPDTPADAIKPRGGMPKSDATVCS